MRAVGIDMHGGTDVLRVRRVPEPVVGAGEVLVRTVASSLNPVDAKTREWEIGTLPANLGWDLSGVVLDSEDERFRPGDRVIAMSAQIATGRGTWADVVSLPGDLLAAAPGRVGPEEAATLPLAGLTALQALESADVGAGDRVLVVGAVGGVGGLAVQLARHLGARVDGLVSRTSHVDAARELGAELVVDDPAELADGVYQVVLHTAGPHVTHALAEGGRYVSIADAPLPDVPGASKSYVEQSGKQLGELARLVDDGVLRLRVAADLPVERVGEAHELFEAGGLTGKVVLTFSPPTTGRGE
ncbi:NADP-dependent oxidoreductase [Actinomadura harenae]|uniref:NADP-dependent oxidoreductase n=2 Tax=Actinomadura harenae TaxID=2483351 RepID=A0A3M2LYG6_9ACTN|nr:NADP-dependent oxidoreductase [Actinomadura harenae]